MTGSDVVGGLLTSDTSMDDRREPITEVRGTSMVQRELRVQGDKHE